MDQKRAEENGLDKINKEIDNEIKKMLKDRPVQCVAATDPQKVHYYVTEEKNSK